jgi:hypothetical protein
MLEKMEIAIKRSVPLVEVVSYDHLNTVRAISDHFTTKDDTGRPIYSWDLRTGLHPVNSHATADWDEELVLVNTLDALDHIANPVEPVSVGIPPGMQPRAIVCMVHAELILDSHYDQYQELVVTLSRMREVLKKKQLMLVLLVDDHIVPHSLQTDFLLLEEVLPTDESIETIVETQYKAANFPEPTVADKSAVVTGCRGLLCDFQIEQLVALSMDRKIKGVNPETIRDYRRAAINDIPGLTLEENQFNFSQVGGMDNIKDYFRLLMNGKEPPQVLVRLEEVEKQVSKTSLNDSNGINKDVLKVLLDEMEGNQWSGMIAVGIPGCAKSLISQAVAGEFGIFTLALDLGACQGGIVGETGKNIRRALSVIRSMSGPGRAYMLATCNNVFGIPDELQSRFSDGRYFFDTPNANDRESIWTINKTRYGITQADPHPKNTEYTGREIRNICRGAYRLDMSIVDYIEKFGQQAAAVSEKEAFDFLRLHCKGKFLSANEPGPYSPQLAKVELGYVSPQARQGGWTQVDKPGDRQYDV